MYNYRTKKYLRLEGDECTIIDPRNTSDWRVTNVPLLTQEIHLLAFPILTKWLTDVSSEVSECLPLKELMTPRAFDLNHLLK